MRVARNLRKKSYRRLKSQKRPFKAKALSRSFGMKTTDKGQNCNSIVLSNSFCLVEIFFRHIMVNSAAGGVMSANGFKNGRTVLFHTDQAGQNMALNCLF